MKLLIVQPWFTAIGHPAQSVLNTARALGVRDDVGYLIADPGDGTFSEAARQLARQGPVARFDSGGDSLRAGTLRALPAIVKLARKHSDLRQVLFLDAHLLVLAATWPVAALFLPRVCDVGTLHLGGPEAALRRPFARPLVERFLSSPGRLFLRTEELAQAWRTALSRTLAGRIDTLPSLEIADAASIARPPDVSGEPTRFGLVGQVRPGKSLEWLVPMFRADPAIGELSVAGTFTNADHRARLQVLSGFAGFDDRFLSEADMLQVAARQHYLLSLYDDWDARMEAATLYLAARVGRPVVVYDEGWPGRMVREYGCGIAVRRHPRPDAAFFRGLPRPGAPAYQALVDGTASFRMAHAGESARGGFLSKLLPP